MTSAVFGAAIASALLHACWNLLAKLRAAPGDTLFGISLATATFGLALLPFVGLPQAGAWPWIAASSVCNVLYLRVLTRAYARSEFNVVYATVRAVVPPFLFLIGWAFFAESGRWDAIAGLILVTVSLVIFGYAKGRGRAVDARGLLYALAAGLVLALALLCDVNGIRLEGGGVAGLLRYSIASSLTTAMALVAVLYAAGRNPLAVLIRDGGLCYAGAVLLLCSYLCGMWAYAQGPIGMVAPLRESGILFGGALAVLVLHEKVSELQWAAMGLATLGVILVQLG